MIDKALDRVGRGGKTIEGKVIAVLLTLSLSLMAWTPFTIKTAFAGDGETDGTGSELVEQTDGDATVGEAGEAAGKEVGADGVNPEAGDPEVVVAAAGDTEEVVKAEPQTFTGSANGVSVSAVDADGVLPEGASMAVSTVENIADVEDAVAAAITGDNMQITAFDISFKDANGQPIEQLEGEVTVTLTSDVISAAVADESTDLVLVHIADGAATEILAMPNGNQITFTASSFSPFALVTKDAAPQTRETEDAWTVNFRNRDYQIIETRQIEKSDEGTAIGALPDPIQREDYNAFWAIGTYTPGEEGGQGSWTTGDIIDSTYVVTSDLDIIPAYTEINYTVTFHNGESASAETFATKTVNVNTSYCLNDIPQVPIKSGYAGKWVYSGGDFSNTVKITEDTDVWIEYTKNVFTVTYKLFPEDESAYRTDTYFTGDALTHPVNPTVEGKSFVKWVDADGNDAPATVTADLELFAQFTDQYWVKFVTVDGDEVVEQLFQYFRNLNEPIGTMPEAPFVEGKVFEKWVKQGTDTEVTAETIVDGNITAVAQFREVSVYNITAEYYYLNDRGGEVVFNKIGRAHV